MKYQVTCAVMAMAGGLLWGCASPEHPGVPLSSPEDTAACTAMAAEGFRPLVDDRSERFEGKVSEAVARCRGGDKAAQFRKAPYVDWANYWATGDAGSLMAGSTGVDGHLNRNGRGIDGALLDLEYQRMELIKFNLFDNAGTYAEYVRGRKGVPGPAIKQWDAMRLPPESRAYLAVGGAGPQVCTGELIRFRNIDGICNDLLNPRMGSTGMPFARNVEFSATFPDLGKNELARNRNGERLGLLKPDPQLISRKLFTRAQSQPDRCNGGQGLPGDSVDAACDYKKAPFFNVLAAFWIQFMTHDWFSHLDEGHNAPGVMPVGCTDPSSGCRPQDRIDPSLYAETSEPATFDADGRKLLTRAYKTTRNNVTGWWDASQLYGYDETSRRRVKRDPADPARLLLIPGRGMGPGDAQGYLPTFSADDPIQPQWAGQEAAAFPDNWSIGMSFFHNVFAREHNAFVDAFRRQAAATPGADSGLRNPSHPDAPIAYREVTANELFEVTRLVIAAEIAKIHTIEWTTQLLYDEPLHLAMNANWSGLLVDYPQVSAALEQIIVNNFGKSENAKKATQWYSALASGPGIFGLGARVYADDAIFAHYDPAKTDLWNIANLDDVNGGVNHFGSPFNFPEEFVSVYRLHPLVPDLIEFREWNHDPNAIRAKVPVINTFRAKATPEMHERGLANWALSMGRQRLGLLTLQNMPAFLQNLSLARGPAGIDQIDVAALDLIRDRERGVPRFNEFRRQYGLRQMISFDDYIDPHATGADRDEQLRLTGLLREVYGQHRCDASKVITDAQRMPDGRPINDCLGHPDGSLVDNVEDVDTMVGWLSEFDRPHGYAISETQFQVFILNASRRLFSDRFFTSSFRPEFYTTLGVDWVNDNGPGGKRWEQGLVNGHRTEVLPLKRVLERAMPELRPELEQVVDVFDPWGRDRGTYYSIDWKPRPGVTGDPAFRP